MCEQLGQEPNPAEMPPDIGDFPLEVQEAFLIHIMMPDRWDGASGSYMGKDWSPLNDLLEINNIQDKKTICFFLKHIDAAHTININQSLKQQQDAQQRRGKAK